MRPVEKPGHENLYRLRVPFFCCKGEKFSLIHRAAAIVGADHEDIKLFRVPNDPDIVAYQSVFCGVIVKCPAIEPRYSGGHAPDPEIAVFIFGNRIYIVAHQSMVGIVHLKVGTIKAA